MSKRILWMAVAAMMAVMSVNAQSDEPKQEIAIGLGGYSNSNIIDAFEDLGGALVGVKFSDGSFFGPISVEYFNHLKPWLGVGGIFAYGSSKQDFFLFSKNDPRDGEMKNSYFTLMPAVKFDWLRGKHFGMYSKLAVGATLRNEKMIYDNPGKDDYNDTEVHVNWQVSLLGLEAGSPQWRGFLELGTGEQGIALIGLRYKF